ncbi:MAG: MarC family protein [Elusimicrobia bacterium]|nr:MarC family protein [Elusimicrobiota bacterium]
MEMFWSVFIPLFVAIDIFGTVPIFLGMMGGVERSRRRKITLQAVLTAFGISLLFLVAGRTIFRLLGITADDFRIGGGLVLLVLAISDLLFSKKTGRDPDESAGVVPLGTPLIIGPAALTTILMLMDHHGGTWTLLSLGANLSLVWLALTFATPLARFFHPAGLKALSKVVHIFLAAIAVMMIRLGVIGLIGLHR